MDFRQRLLGSGQAQAAAQTLAGRARQLDMQEAAAMGAAAPQATSMPVGPDELRQQAKLAAVLRMTPRSTKENQP